MSGKPKKVEVLQSGIQTSIQDVNGRLGYCDVGVPPSGAIDPLLLNIANQILRYPFNTARLECTLQGPTLKFHCDSQIVITGGDMLATLDGVDVAMWQTLNVKKGQILKTGKITTGCRSYIGIKGGLNVPSYLGSQATFILGQFGGHAGDTIYSLEICCLLRPYSSVETVALSAAQLPSFRQLCLSCGGG